MMKQRKGLTTHRKSELNSWPNIIQLRHTREKYMLYYRPGGMHYNGCYNVSNTAVATFINMVGSRKNRQGRGVLRFLFWLCLFFYFYHYYYYYFFFFFFFCFAFFSHQRTSISQRAVQISLEKHLVPPIASQWGSMPYQYFF